MFTQYVESVMKRARYEHLRSDGKYFGSIPRFKGVWAQGKTRRDCEHNLREVLEEWLLLKIRKRQFVPTVRRFNLNALFTA